MKVFGLILYNKFICPGYTVRVSREAPMVKDFDAAKLKDVDLCQLVVDELRKAIFEWKKATADWAAIPGCGIALLLIYLDCIDNKDFSPKDMRSPRILYFSPYKLRKLADLDCIEEGNERPDSWTYGKLPVSFVFLLTLLYFSFVFLLLMLINFYFVFSFFCSGSLPMILFIIILHPPRPICVLRR